MNTYKVYNIFVALSLVKVPYQENRKIHKRDVYELSKLKAAAVPDEDVTVLWYGSEQ